MTQRRLPGLARSSARKPAPPLDAERFGLLAAAIAATLAMHLGHAPWPLMAALYAVLAGRVVTRLRRPGKIPAWLRLPAALALLVAVVALYGNVFGRQPGSVLGCGLLVLKLLETEHARDAKVALGFCAFVLMSALLFGQSLAFTALVCVVMVLLLAALVALQPAPLPGARLRSAIATAARLAGLGLPLALAAFLLVPRLSAPLWGAPGQDQTARTGLSETMSPGMLTELLTDDSPALRVVFDGAPPAPALRYFRTLVMWDFDGTTWARSGFLGASRDEDVRIDGSPVSYEITLEPTDRGWLPALDVPLAAPEGARLTGDRVLIMRRPITQPMQYRVRSATAYVLESELEPQARRRALALPDGFNPRARALARQWLGEGRRDETLVRAALDLFHREFTYSLSAPELGRNSVDDFLFGTKTGFCEHYASAFVFLMRAAGLPARVVTGYQGGWWNASGGYLLVRQSDAHAWAEVWIEGKGWRRIDPTAAVSPERVELGAAAVNAGDGWAQSEWMRALRNRVDLVNRLWTQGVIRFDRLRQSGLLTSFGVSDANPGDLMLALSAVLAALLLAATVWAIRPGSVSHGDAMDRAWARIRSRLARGGIESPASEGPLDLLRRARAASAPLGDRLEPLAKDYIALRYGTETDTERRRRFLHAARRFRVPRRPN